MMIHLFDHIPAKTVGFLDDLRAKRDAHLAHRELARELSAYDTPAQISDLLAAIADAPEDEAAEVRGILQHNLVTLHAGGRAAS